MVEAAKTKETITLEEARRVIDGAARKAEEIGQPMDIAVVDAGGNLKAHVRMDGAFVGSITISINKAYTAIAFQQETAHLQEDTRPGPPWFWISFWPRAWSPPPLTSCPTRNGAGPLGCYVGRPRWGRS
jgi:uncharacterized protein GlcG (DUF336 family)